MKISTIQEVNSPYPRAKETDNKRGFLGIVKHDGSVIGYDTLVPDVMAAEHNDLEFSPSAHGRFRYFVVQNVFLWLYLPTEEEKHSAENWVYKRGGYNCDKHVNYNNYLWLLKEGEVVNRLDRKIQNLEQQWDQLDHSGTQYERQKSIEKELEKLRKQRAHWEKLYGAVDVKIEGVSHQDGKLHFDFNKDWFNDIIRFFSAKFSHKAFHKRNVHVFFGYALTAPEFYNDKEVIMHRNAVRTMIKNFDRLSAEEHKHVIRLIDDSLKKLNEYKPLTSYEMVVSVESTAPLNKLIIERLRSYLNPDALVVDNLFIKNTIDKIDLDWNMLDREQSEATKEMVLSIYDRVLKSKSMFFIKDLKSSVRRYFTKFLRFNGNTQKEAFEHIFGHNVLLVDDTVGEVSTFTDMLRLLNEYKPKECLCYALLKDY